jgi:hypothetical protein
MTQLTLTRLLSLARSAVRIGKEVKIVSVDGASSLIAGHISVGTLAADLPSYPVIGCDLLNYSGLTDIEQFVFGVVLEERLSEALRFARMQKRILAANGTGDGVLMALDCRSDELALLFALRLWWEGRRCILGHDGRWRGLRVVFSRGPCLLGKDFSGSVQMQGYGLIENARILHYDKGTHFLISKQFWTSQFGKERHAEFKCEGWNCKLRIVGRVRQGKAKAGDRNVTAFYNLVGTVQRVGGHHKHRWRVGCSSPKGLSTPN